VAIDRRTLDEVIDLSQRLSPSDQLRLISQLSEQLSDVVTDWDEIERIDMLSMVGVGADLWQSIDVDAYLDQERASWET